MFFQLKKILTDRKWHHNFMTFLFVNIGMVGKGPEISLEVRKLAVDLHQNRHRVCEKK